MFNVDLQILDLSFLLSIDFQHVHLVKLLCPQLDMLVIQSIILLLKLSNLLFHVFLSLNVLLHLLIFKLKAFFIDSFGGV